MRNKITSARKRNNQSGFTIVELVIAMTVSSVIMTVFTTGFVQISRMYYRGILQAKTQELARTVMDEISRPIQFSGLEPVPEASSVGGVTPIKVTQSFSGVQVNAFCIGDKRYSYTTGYQLWPQVDIAASRLKHVFWRDTIAPGSACVPLNLTTTADKPRDAATVNPVGRELLTTYTRLHSLEVTRLSHPADEQGLYSIRLRILYGDNDVLNGDTCKSDGFLSSQFCAVSPLSTVVLRRLR